jgi:single-stranded DNA-specific DHH superfamily exonuclease
VAELIKRVVTDHHCAQELDQLHLENPELAAGTRARCSCGKIYVLREDHREELYWEYTQMRSGQ